MVLKWKIGNTEKELEGMHHLVHWVNGVCLTVTVKLNPPAGVTQRLKKMKNIIAFSLIVGGMGACSASSTPVPLNPTRTGQAPTPAKYNEPPATDVPASGPTLAASSQVALNFLNALPSQIGRFTLVKTPTKTYVATD